MVLDPLVRSFDNLDAATQARQAVIDAGVDPELVQTHVIQDEAGPVEGNFLIGNGRTAHGGEPSAVLAGPDVPYESNFEHVVTRGVHMVMVHAADPALRERVQAILAQLGGVDPQARAAAGAPR